MAGLTKALSAITNKNDDLFAIEIEGLEIVFRLPSTKQAIQFKILLEMASESTANIIHETIFRNCVIDEYLANKANDIPAGIPQTISNLILFLSGQGKESQNYTELLFESYRAQRDSNDMYMKRVICQVFTSYTFDMLDEINYQKLVNIFIQAEKVLLDRGIIEKEHSFTSPEEEKPKPFRVEDVINQDSNAYSEFDSVENPEVMANMARLRAEAIERAKAEEERFRQNARRQR